MRGQDLFYMGVDRKCIHMMQTEQADTCLLYTSKHRQGGPPAKRAVSAWHMGRKTAPHREKNTCMGQIFVV